MRVAGLFAVALASGAWLFACGSSESGGSTSTGGVSAGGASTGGASTGGSTSGGTSGAAGDSGTDGVAPDPNGCQKAGGQCGCAGGCSPGFHPAPDTLLWQCPQPCDQCGACSQQCCVPDDAGAGSQCGVGGVCISGSTCPAGLTLTQLGCPLDAQLGSCCVQNNDGG